MNQQFINPNILDNPDLLIPNSNHIQFFKPIYRRHTNFAVHDFGKKISFTIPQNGDLINHQYIQVKFPNLQEMREKYRKYLIDLVYVEKQVRPLIAKLLSPYNHVIFYYKEQKLKPYPENIRNYGKPPPKPEPINYDDDDSDNDIYPDYIYDDHNLFD